MSEDQIFLSNTPEIPGLSFRHFCGESDYGPIAKVLTSSDRADQFDREVSVEFITTVFSSHLTNCDPYTDMIFAEVAGDVVGYTRGWWTEESTSMRLYKHSGFLLPAWRRKGIGTVMLNWIENRLKDIAGTHPLEQEKYLQVNFSQSQTGAAAMVERSGYLPVRYFFQMVRPNLDNIPDFPLPDGLEIRPVAADHYPAIWESIDETSQDEWGYTEPTEEDFQEWLVDPHFQPHLWRIAWDKATNQVVGHVLTYINHQENNQFDRKSGYTEGIGVSKEWRRHGVASALISLSLKAQKAAGMIESALVADSESISGVTRLYEACGFLIVDRDTIYRKQL